MRRILVVAVALVAIFASACGGGGKAVKPSELHPSLSKFDADDQNPFMKEGSKVEYISTEMANYDQFFRDAAFLQATMIYADLTIKDVQATIGELAKGNGIDVPAEGANWGEIAKAVAAKKDGLTPEDTAKLTDLASRLKVLGELAVKVPETATALIAQGQNFKNTAPNDFAKNPLKLPEVTAGIGSSLSALTDAAARAPDVAKSVGDLALSLAAFAG
jgi:hypothetical protein